MSATISPASATSRVERRRPRRGGARRARRGRGPGRAPSRASAAPPAARRAASRAAAAAARISARDRRVATRKRWRSSGSVPSRTPGSCVSSSRSWRVSRKRTCSSAGASGGGAATPSSSRTRITFEVALGRVRAGAPEDAAEAVEVALVAVDELDLDLGERAREMARVEHVDRVDDDVRERALAGDDADADPARAQRRDRREARRSAGAPGAAPRARAARRPARRRPRARSRPPSRGSLSCQRERPFSSRRRSVIPQRARLRGGVS